jgi:hypothetical protein
MAEKRLEARKALDFLQRSKLVRLDMPVEELVRGVSELEQVAGYVLAWDKYVLVVATEVGEEVIQPGP